MIFCRRGIFPAIALVASLWAAEAAAETVTLENVRILGNNAPIMRVTGASLDSVGLAASFAEIDDTAAFVALKADRVEIPELNWTSPEGEGNIFTWRDIVLEKMDKGVVEKFDTGPFRRQAYDGKLEFAALRGEALRFGPLFKHMSESGLDGLAGLSTAMSGNTTAIEPMISQLDLTGLSFGIPGFSDPMTPNGISISSLSVVNSNFFGTMPQKSSVRWSEARLSLAGNATDRDAIFARTPLDGQFDMRWDAATKDLSIDKLQVKPGALGSLTVTAKLKNVDALVFQGDEVEYISAWLGVSLTAMSLAIEDKGLSEELFRLIAEPQGKTSPEARGEATELVRLTVPLFLGKATENKAIVEALASFVQEPGYLGISATPKSGSLGAADFVALEGPADILSKLDLVVSTSP